MAVVQVHTEQRRGTPRLIVDIEYVNSGKSTERLEQRYLAAKPHNGTPRTDFVWIFDGISRSWLEYRSPTGRPRSPRPEDYVVLGPGEKRRISGLDVTDNHVLPLDWSGLAAKVFIASGAIESKCVPLHAGSVAHRGNVRRDCWLEPCQLTGDFDDDGNLDEAMLVVETQPPKRRGVWLVMGSGKTFTLGAGTAVGNGGGDFEWMDQWRVVPKKQAAGQLNGAAGDGLFVGKSESASGLIGLVNGRPRWKQLAD